MKTVDYEKNSRWYKVELPDDADESQAEMGIPIGPPDLGEVLPLPDPFATRLHNEFFARGIFTLSDTMRKQNEVKAAIAAALRLDINAIQQAFQEIERLKAQEVNDG